MSNSIIIMTSLGDEHACAVHRVLTRMGIDVHLYLPTEILGAGDVTIDYAEDDVRLTLSGFDGHLSEIGSSWNRRLSQTFREPAFVHPADRDHLVYAAHSINRGIAALLDTRFPINPLASTVVTSNKLVQLATARRCGFRTPRTVITSDPMKAGAFVEAEGTACVKPYTMYSWVTDAGVKASTTAVLKSPLSLDPASIALVPDIYQEFIDKATEYRVTIFGGYVAVTKLGEGLTEAGAVDWRADASYLTGLQHATVPEKVVEALRRIMSSLGLRFGTFDIAQDNDGDYVFFEVNESGQWLWQELYADGCRILEPFCRYLAAATDDFVWERVMSLGIHAADVLAAVRSDPFYRRVLPEERFNQVVVTEREILEGRTGE